MSKGLVLSLFDHSGVAVRDWAAAGYECFCIDILHPEKPRVEELPGGGRIGFVRMDLNPDSPDWHRVGQAMAAARARGGNNIMFAWPPCDDLAASGARHWGAKLEADPDCQKRAAERAEKAVGMADAYRFKYIVENPIGALSRLWRRHDCIWHPYQYGGYLPKDDVHPVWPEYIAPRDAYTKATCAWYGGGFVMPEQKPVKPEILERTAKSGNVVRGSRQFFRLGGKSAKTKEIRSMTPRGAARAFFEANA